MTAEEAQKDLLGWCLCFPGESIPRAMKFVNPEDFFTDPDDRAIYQAMIDLHTRGELVDLVTLARELKGKVDDYAMKLAVLVDRPFSPRECPYMNLLLRIFKGITKHRLKGE